MRKRLLSFIQKNDTNRFLIGFTGLFAFGVILQFLLIYPVKTSYYGLLSGNYFLNVTTVQVGGQDARIVEGEDGDLLFCRDPRARVVAERNIRTYWEIQDGTELQVFERTLPDGISYQKSPNPCQELPLRVDNLARLGTGTFRFCQEFDFTLNGFYKSARFCSNDFEIVKGDS